MTAYNKFNNTCPIESYSECNWTLLLIDEWDIIVWIVFVDRWRLNGGRKPYNENENAIWLIIEK